MAVMVTVSGAAFLQPVDARVAACAHADPADVNFVVGSAGADRGRTGERGHGGGSFQKIPAFHFALMVSEVSVGQTIGLCRLPWCDGKKGPTTKGDGPPHDFHRMGENSSGRRMALLIFETISASP